MERLVYQPACGCQVYRIMNSKPNLYRIQYCPLHAQAPKLYEALKELLDWARLSFSDDTGEWADKNDPAIKQAEQAIAGVEVKHKTNWFIRLLTFLEIIPLKLFTRQWVWILVKTGRI